MANVIKPSKDPMLFLGPGRLALAKLEQVLSGAVRRAIPIEGLAGAGFEGLRLRRAGYAAIAGNFDGERAGGLDTFAGADPGGIFCD